MEIENEDEFKFMVWSFAGKDLDVIDQAIEEGQSIGMWASPVGQKNRERLQELRAEVFEAYKADNIPLMQARAYLLDSYVSDLSYRFTAHAKAVQGSKQARTQSKKASQPRKTTEEQQISIAKEFQHGMANGDGYGLAKELARRHDISTNTVRAIAKKHKPK